MTKKLLTFYVHLDWVNRVRVWTGKALSVTKKNKEKFIRRIIHQVCIQVMLQFRYFIAIYDRERKKLRTKKRFFPFRSDENESKMKKQRRNASKKINLSAHLRPEWGMNYEI